MYYPLFLTALFAVLATTVMTYISMATQIGPWMGPTLALLSLGLFSAAAKQISSARLITPVIGGSSGGIIATAVGFSLPTLYFVAPDYFFALQQQPWLFCCMFFLVVLSACAVGVVAAWLSDAQLRGVDKLSFPIGQLQYDIIASRDNKQGMFYLLTGTVATAFYFLVKMVGAIPSAIVIWGKRTWSCIAVPAFVCDLTMLPMVVAIGFVAGNSMTIPLLVGAAGRIILLDPVNAYFFPDVSASDFVSAFCSGMVVCGALQGMPAVAKKLYVTAHSPSRQLIEKISLQQVVGAGILFASVYGSFYYFGFSWSQVLFILFGACLCAYQIMAIAGKTGLAPLGRFATFVMIPGMLFFGVNPVQAVILALFVELVGGVATDELCARTSAQLAAVQEKQYRLHRIVGMLVSAVCVVIVFYMLTTHFALGSEQLCAQRAQARALLIRASEFNIFCMLFGLVSAFLLKWTSLNSTFVLGGLLMMPSLVIPLVIGGIFSLLPATKKSKEQFDSLAAGVFATNALGVVLPLFWG